MLYYWGYQLMPAMIQGMFCCVVMNTIAEREDGEKVRKKSFIFLGLMLLWFCAEFGNKQIFFSLPQIAIIFFLTAISALCIRADSFILKKLLFLVILCIGVGVIYNKLYVKEHEWKLIILFVLLTGIICAGIYCLIYKIIRKYNMRWNDSELVIGSSALIIGVYTGIYSFISYNRRNDLNLIYTFQIMVALIQFIIVAILSFSVMIYELYKKLLENQVMGVSYEQNQMNVDKIQKMYAEASKMRHDIKNCMLLIDSYIQNNQYQEARRYIAEYMVHQIQMPGVTLYCSNMVLNYIINHKFEICTQNHIEKKCIISGSVDAISKVDLSILIGNLLDNAIEAAVLAEHRMISLEIYDQEDIQIIVQNSIRQSVLKNNPEMSTNKKNRCLHGFGIMSIKKIVDQYHGKIEYSEVGLIFQCKIILKKEILYQNLP